MKEELILRIKLPVEVSVLCAVVEAVTKLKGNDLFCRPGMDGDTWEIFKPESNDKKPSSTIPGK